MSTEPENNYSFENDLEDFEELTDFLAHASKALQEDNHTLVYHPVWNGR